MINVNGLDFAYRKKDLVFSDLNLTLEAGHVYGLLGKNGVGKSTLLKLLTGLLFPKRGEIKVMGYTPRFRQPSFFADLFFIPEEVFAPSLKMKEYARLMAPFYPKFNRQQLDHYMTEFQIQDNKRLDRLSLGQRKKALIAFGLACNTSLLIMDEPTNGLDIPSKSEFRKLIASVATEERCVIISTHQVRDLDNLIDAIVIMDEKRILMNATTDKITERLLFTVIREGEDALFEDVSVRGRWGVKKNIAHEESKLDMELFFNAVLKNPSEMERLFQDIH